MDGLPKLKRRRPTLSVDVLAQSLECYRAPSSRSCQSSSSPAPSPVASAQVQAVHHLAATPTHKRRPSFSRQPSRSPVPSPVASNPAQAVHLATNPNHRRKSSFKKQPSTVATHFPSMGSSYASMHTAVQNGKQAWTVLHSAKLAHFELPRSVHVLCLGWLVG